MQSNNDALVGRERDAAIDALKAKANNSLTANERHQLLHLLVARAVERFDAAMGDCLRFPERLTERLAAALEGHKDDSLTADVEFGLTDGSYKVTFSHCPLCRKKADLGTQQPYFAQSDGKLVNVCPRCAEELINLQGLVPATDQALQDLTNASMLGDNDECRHFLEQVKKTHSQLSGRLKLQAKRSWLSRIFAAGRPNAADAVEIDLYQLKPSTAAPEAQLATPPAEETCMQSCDVCAQSTTWAQGTSYTADDFRELVARGFEPVEQMASYLAQAKALHGLDEQKALFAWKNGLVAQSTTHWLLCPGCASLAARHLPRPAGGKPPERISEPLTDKMFVAPPPAQVAVTDYHSRGQSDAPSASRRPPADLPARTDSEKSTSRADVAPQAKTSDTFSFPCPSCGKRLKANRTLIGRRAKCRTCGSAVDIPDPLHAANGANDATQPPTGQTTTAEATTAEVRTAHSTTTPATTNPVPTDAPQSTTSPADGSEVPCCSCGDAIPESARRADVVGDMLGLLGSLTGGGLGNANQSRKTMPDLLFGGAMKCASCGRWMCCSCAERKAKAQGASHAALIASQARGTITHEGCGGIFERP